ncbi:MAG: IS200/IS605 family transposase, partial [Candidatus Hydrothermarchaeaceae archaeon]
MPAYHVWFATKRRKWLLQGDVAEVAKDTMRTVAKETNIGLKECETMVDHVHLLVEAENRMYLAKAINLLKGTSSRRLLHQFPDLKLDAQVKSFWQHRYGAKEIPESATAAVGQYIRTQWHRLDEYE